MRHAFACFCEALATPQVGGFKGSLQQAVGYRAHANRFGSRNTESSYASVLVGDVGHGVVHVKFDEPLVEGVGDHVVLVRSELHLAAK